MSHPKAMDAMLSGELGITAHLASHPFQDHELADPRVRRALDSYRVPGGVSPFNLVWTRENFFPDNPGTKRRAQSGDIRRRADSRLKRPRIMV